jgi:hypothetical protein
MYQYLLHFIALLFSSLPNWGFLMTDYVRYYAYLQYVTYLAYLSLQQLWLLH